jgi:DNA-binding XRE family transcriptional regulator
MQAVVKTPHTEIIINGIVSTGILEALRQEYGNDLKIIEEDQAVNVFETEWYRTVKANMKPGDYVRICREKKGWTQTELGMMLGGIPRQHVSNMERGVRPISLQTARKLASIFDAEISNFICCAA